MNKKFIAGIILAKLAMVFYVATMSKVAICALLIGSGVGYILLGQYLRNRAPEGALARGYFNAKIYLIKSLQIWLLVCFSIFMASQPDMPRSTSVIFIACAAIWLFNYVMALSSARWEIKHGRTWAKIEERMNNLPSGV